VRRPLLRLTRRCLAALALVAAVAAPASASSAAAAASSPDSVAGSIGLRLLDVPAAAAGDPRARIYIVDHVAPGAVIHRRIEVFNTTASAAQVSVYPAAAAIAKGSFLGAAGHSANELSTWTTVRPGTLAVPARTHLPATVTVVVPRDAAPGERYGVVWAEIRSATVAGAGVTEISRVGIRLYLSIGSGGPPASDFTITALAAQRSSDGRPQVLATVHNTGGRALDMNGTLRLLAGPGGLTAGPFPAALGTTLGVGDTEPVTIVLDKRLPAGPWDARITLRSGLLTRSARAAITFPATGASPPVSTDSLRPGWLYAAIAALLILVLTLTMLLVRRGRLRGRPAEGGALDELELVTSPRSPGFERQGPSRSAR
jgi:hypothetical protein